MKTLVFGWLKDQLNRKVMMKHKSDRCNEHDLERILEKILQALNLQNTNLENIASILAGNSTGKSASLVIKLGNAVMNKN